MSRLDRIGDWQDRATKARYGALRLALDVGVTRQQLNRYFRSRFGITAHGWLQQAKLKVGILMLRQGKSVKEVAGELGFQHSTHFSRAFRHACGESPTRTASAMPHRMT